MRAAFGTALIFALFQAVFPLRAFLYGGDILWHEQGMRWSWRVMLREKNASVRFRVKADGRETVVPPRWYLTRWQEREMGSQPDLILQLAHHVATEFRARGYHDVEVRADVVASLNGRPAETLIDPNVDLSRTEDGFGQATWILPRGSR